MRIPASVSLLKKRPVAPHAHRIKPIGPNRLVKTAMADPGNEVDPAVTPATVSRRINVPASQSTKTSGNRGAENSLKDYSAQSLFMRLGLFCFTTQIHTGPAHAG